MNTLNQKKLETLKSLRKKVNWNIEEERRELLHQLYPLVKDWTEQLPNLRDIFRCEEIDWLLTESLKSARFDAYRTKLIPLVQFVAQTSYKDEPEVDVNGKPSSSRTTPLHYTFEDPSILKYPKLIDNLFQVYDRFDVNYTHESGVTHFHVACFFGCDEFVEKFLELGQDPNILMPFTGDTPLHLALQYRHKKATELLLKYGANPNLANVWDVTPLHNVCNSGHDNADLAEILFEMSDEKHHPIQVNAQNKFGWTPLHFALHHGCKKGIAQVLLRKGANPNFPNVEGSTPLHLICHNIHNSMYHSDIDLAKLFFEINNERQQLVEVNVRDNSGNAPLHLALKRRLENLTELLLRRGADANLANEKGSTPLHMICEKQYYDRFDVVELFFKISDERKQTVEVNARDCCGRTPLQLAVANLNARAVDLLLNHGADLSLFVFPSDSYLDQLLRQNRRCEDHLKLMLACLAIIENLEKKGHDMDRSAALTIMKLFAQYELFDRWTYNGPCWDYDFGFMSKAKETMIKSNLSLYNLITLRPEDAEKRLTCKNYYEFFTDDFVSLLGWSSKRCTRYLSEKVSRRFFRRWTLDYFLELTGYRLPILCCDIIIKRLMNKDLWNICSAVSGQVP